MISAKLALQEGHKWARFFRFQMAVKQTAKNRQRLAYGKKPVGRPMPRLVSIDFEDAYMVQADWSARQAVAWALTESPLAYFAVFIDGEYYAIPRAEVSQTVIQACLDRGKLTVLPMEGIAKW